MTYLVGILPECESSFVLKITDAIDLLDAFSKASEAVKREYPSFGALVMFYDAKRLNVSDFKNQVHPLWNAELQTWESQCITVKPIGKQS